MKTAESLQEIYSSPHTQLKNKNLNLKKKKKCCITFRGNLLFCSFCQLPLVQPLGNTEKGLAPLPLHSPFSYLCKLIRFPLSIFFCRLNSPNSLSLSSYERCSTPLIILAGLQRNVSMSNVSLVLGRTDLDTVLHV